MSGWTPNTIGGQDGTPGVLFHGTKREHLAAIRRDGLRPAEPTFWGPGQEPVAVYLTDGLRQAHAHADNEECVLVVDVTGLPLLRLGFVTCMEPIGPERISSLPDHPGLMEQLACEELEILSMLDQDGQ